MKIDTVESNINTNVLHSGIGEYRMRTSFAYQVAYVTDIFQDVFLSPHPACNIWHMHNYRLTQSVSCKMTSCPDAKYAVIPCHLFKLWNILYVSTLSFVPSLKCDIFFPRQKMTSCLQTQYETTSCPLLWLALLFVPRHNLQDGSSSYVLQLPLIILMAAGDGLWRVAYLTTLNRAPARCVHRVSVVYFRQLLRTLLDRSARNSRFHGPFYGVFSSRLRFLARVSTAVVDWESK